MLKRLKSSQHQSLAEAAAKEVAPAGGVGKFLGTVSEQANVFSYRFESKLKGYEGWAWNVVVFEGKKPHPATISEVVMLPGVDSIVAPVWVPWSERKAELELDKSEATESAVSNLEVTKDTEPDSEDAGERPPRRKGLLKRLVQKQNGNKSKNPSKRSK
jgi:hypothetical protein